VSDADQAGTPLPPQARAIVDVQRVDALLKAGRSADAARLAREALADDPENVVLLKLLTLAVLDTGEFAEACDVAQRTVSLSPDDAAALRNLGYATYKCGDTAQAGQILDRSLALRPDDSLTVAMRADVLMREATARGRSKRRRAELLEQAEQLGRDAVRLRPDQAVGFVIQGKVAVARNDPFRASALARDALAVEPDNAVAHQVLGMAAQLSGDTAAAADHYVSAGRLNPGGGSTTLLRKLRGAPVVGVIAGIVLTRIALRAGAAVGGVVLAIVLVVALWAVLLYYPKWKARRSMSADARTVLDRDRQLRGR
jgi:Flp pilus assembly protein TadD